MSWRGEDGGGGRVWYVWVSGIWDDGVNGQRKTRGEAMVVGANDKHGAHLRCESQENC